MDHAGLQQTLLLRLDSGLEDAEIVMAREVQAWPWKAFNVLIESGMLVTHSPAISIACEECSEGHFEEVEALEYPTEPTLRYFIACPTCGRVEIPPDKLRRWRIDLGGLAKTVGCLLNVSGVPKEVVQHRVWDIGWADAGGGVRDFLLVRGLGWSDSLDMSRLLAGRQHPVVLILGDLPSPNGDTPTVPLLRVLSMNATRLVLDARYLNALPVPEQKVAVHILEQYAFKRQGDCWIVSFNGKQTILRALQGIDYIAYLLRHPNEEVSASELASLGSKDSSEPAIPRAKSLIGDDLFVGGFSVSDLGDAGDVLDDTAKTAYRARIREIDAVIAKSGKAIDDHKRSELQNEKTFITRQLNAATGLGGRKRKAASVADRSRSSVRHSITASIKYIGRYDRDLAKSLFNAITTGSNCVYHPDRNVSWVF